MESGELAEDEELAGVRRGGDVGEKVTDGSVKEFRSGGEGRAKEAEAVVLG